MTRWGRLIGAVALVAVVAACSGADQDRATNTAAGEAGDVAAPDVDGEFAGGSSSGGATAGGSGSSGGGGGQGSTDESGGDGSLPDAVPAATRQEKVIKTAELRVELKKGSFREAFERATFLAGTHQGFVADSSSERSSDGLAAGHVIIRVPSDRFDAARKDLATLGKVKAEQVKGQDVSGQLVDLGARLANLRAQEASLRELMDSARNVPETMQVQQHLFSVREQIEQLAAQEARLQSDVAMSTIRVSLAETGAAILNEPEPEPKGLAAAFENAVDGAISVISAMVIAVGYLTPVAVLVGLLLVGARLLRRPHRRLAAEG